MHVFSTECTIGMVEGNLKCSAAMELGSYGAKALSGKLLRGIYGNLA